MNKESNKPGIFLGINTMMDPAVAIVKNGEVIAYSEEERHVRIKHAIGLYPKHALQYCLSMANCNMEDISCVAINWDLEAYSNGRMEKFYDSLRKNHPVDDKTIAWQKSRLKLRNIDIYRENHVSEWKRIFGDIDFPPMRTFSHHYTHAFHSYSQSTFDSAICLTIDGSGDQDCTVVWACNEKGLEPIHEIKMPHSLGWLYAAITEYLGFKAYDGEYKVMGLAAYGKPNIELSKLIEEIVYTSEDGFSYEVDGTFIHYGEHTYSNRYTDKLVKLFGRPPRLENEEFTSWHEDLSFAVQEALEKHVINLVKWAIKKTGVRKICIGGGVGLNVKMNSKLFQLKEVDDIFVHPLCSDSGAAIGAALLACQKTTGIKPSKLSNLSFGPEENDADIERILKTAGISYRRSENICDEIANELADGRIVGWFQGRMEAGPRALGNRSILADSRVIANRDKVNSIIKFREYWRPFCPSILAEYMNRYFESYTEAAFMVISFVANDKLKNDAPAIVHVDGTARVQMVSEEANKKYHQLIKTFNDLTGVPVLLNTSFNVRGEPVVCTAQDALRTFWSTGLEVLAIEDFIIRKPIIEK